MRVVSNKLVRDQVPEIIEQDGHRAVTRVLDADSFQRELRVKLVEEAQEACAASAELLPSELADVLEVLMALATEAGLSWDSLVAITAAKRTERGAFSARLYLEYVEQNQ